jgi:hypothetical protein
MHQRFHLDCSLIIDQIGRIVFCEPFPPGRSLIDRCRAIVRFKSRLIFA